MNKDYFKVQSISPEKVFAGDSVEITIRLTLGKDFSALNSTLMFDMPAHLGFSRPTVLDQEEGGYVAVFCSNPDIKYEKHVYNPERGDFFKRDGHISNMLPSGANRLFVIRFKEGAAQENDEIVLKWGYIRNGFGVGTKITTIVPEKNFFVPIDIRYFEEGERAFPDFARSFKNYERPHPDLEHSISLRILPREPECIRIIRSLTHTSIRILDRFANVCDISTIDEYVQCDGVGEFNSHGVYVIDNPNTNVISKGLPMDDAPQMQDVFEGMNIYFGDLHTHSSSSNDCIEREKLAMDPQRSFEYAKKVAGLDFLAVTDHHQPWDIEQNKIGEANWHKLQEAIQKHHKDGEFVAFAGFEFRCKRGDTAVILNQDMQYSEIDISSMTDVRELWKEFKGKDYITIPHFHLRGTLELDEWYECPNENIETVLEIYSCHGSYERPKDEIIERPIPLIKPFRLDRNGKYFLQHGYKYGYTCNSDGHKGNPGSNGLTAVYATELSRNAIIQAIRNRNIYGTTNARIRLLFTANNHLMGAVIPNTSKKVFYIALTGTQHFKAVDIFRNGEHYKRFKPYTCEFSTTLQVDEDVSSNWYIRATQIDNHIAYSSPVWFE